MSRSNKYLTAFTVKSEGIANRLKSTATIAGPRNTMVSVNALWDTGATNTCISDRVVEMLKLKYVETKQFDTADGTRESDLYLADIYLPRGIYIRDLKVVESDISIQGFDALIGMDIIGLGDFSVTNVNGSTTFSFRIPSQEEIDYEEQLRLEKEADS